MKPVFTSLLGFFLFASIAGAGDKASGYSQSYAILIKGVLAGSETVTETTSDAGDLVSTSEHEIFVTDGIGTKRMAFSTKMIFAKTTQALISYNYKYHTGDTGDFYDVVVKNAQVTRTLSRGGKTSEVTVPLQPNMVFIDVNVYHQYDYLIRRYDAKKGGRQLFADFVPVIGNDIPLAVTFLDSEKLPLNNGEMLPVKNFKVEFVGIWGGSLSVDKDGRLVRLIVPNQDLQVVRKDLLPASQ